MKKTLRQELLQRRKALSPELVLEYSQKITARVLESELIQKSQVIMVYMDFRNEVMTQSLIESLWTLGKTVVIPKVNDTTHVLDLYTIKAFTDMVVSSFGILEPNPAVQPDIKPQDIDLVLAPGVCFDRRGFRMGYGGGFYDKLLPTLRPDCQIHALSFSLQIVDEVPTEPHDMPLNGIVTEMEWIVSEN